MIEMRIVEIGDGCRPEFQYRYKLPETDVYYSKTHKLIEWSNWETALWVGKSRLDETNYEEVKND
jgi:hypothetical protein